jgi:hypothetical protein
MGMVEILWTAVGIIVPVLVGWGASMMGLNPPEFKVARWCFWLSALILAAMTTYWLTTTDQPIAIRIVVGVLVGALIFVGLPETLRWVTAREMAAQPKDKPELHMSDYRGPINVTSYNQSGGITAHTVNVGATARRITDPRAAPLKEQILRELPKDKPITILAVMGDTEAIQFAYDIHAFMKENGFNMKEPNGISQGVFAGVVNGLQRRDEPDGSITFIVGANTP